MARAGVMCERSKNKECGTKNRPLTRASFLFVYTFVYTTAFFLPKYFGACIDETQKQDKLRRLG